MKGLLTYPAAAWILLATAVDSSAEPVQWPVNGHYYEAVLVPGGISWDEADAAATAAGRYLATIASQEENDFVFGLVDFPAFWTAPVVGNRGPWLGGFQFPDSGGPEDDWQWVTGEPWGYTNWADGQPNDLRGWKEDKLHFFEPSDGELRAPTWNDIRNVDTGGVPIAYVTEWVPEPSTVVLVGVAAACALVFLGRRYDI